MSTPTLPAGFRKINFENQLNKARKNIPFIPEEGSCCVILRAFEAPPIDSSPIHQYAAEQWAIAAPIQKNRVTRRLIYHFFPEYYPLTLDDADLTAGEKAAVAWYKPDYLELKRQIKDSLTVRRTIYLGPPPIKHKIVWETTLDLSQKRAEMLTNITTLSADNPDVPEIDFLAARDVLNRKLERGEQDSNVTVRFQNVPKMKEQFAAIFPGLGALLHPTPGASPPHLNSMQMGVGTIIKKITDSIHDTIDFGERERQVRTGTQDQSGAPLYGTTSGQFDTDYFTVYFDEDMDIVSITYMVATETFGASVPSIIGYITNVKYNPLYRDHGALRLLKNHQALIEMSQESNALGQQPPWREFFENLGMGPDIFGGVELYGSSQPGAGNPDTYIDISNYENLATAFKSAKDQVGMSEEELQKLEDMRQDPVFLAKMYQAQKARKVNTALNVFDKLTDVLNADVFQFMNATPAGRKFNQVLASFGVQDMAKEAVICLTLGQGTTAARLTDAMRAAILQGSVSLNSPPTPPSSQNGLSRPNLGITFSKMKPKEYFSVNSHTSKKIGDVFLNALAQGGLEIIKGIAEMFKIGCGDMWDAMLGAVDIGSECKRRNLEANIMFPDLTLDLEAAATQIGITLKEAYDYYSEVSTILTPIEVCRLLNSQDEVTAATVEKILEFNENYPAQGVQLALNSRTAILSHFGAMTGYIDTVTFCNEIINDYVMNAISGCEICIDPDDAPDNPIVPIIEELADIAENGIQIPLPPMPDLLCSESSNYIESPVATQLIPNLMNNIVDTTKIYMAGSLESARTKLLDPVVDGTVDSEFRDGCESAEIELPEESPDKAALQFVQGLLTTLQTLGNNFFDFAENCPEVKNFQSLIEDKDLVLEAINAAGDEIPDIIEEAANKIDSIGNRMSSSAGAFPHTRYVFPELFEADFNNALKATEMLMRQDDPFQTFTGHPKAGAINTSNAIYRQDTGKYQGSSVAFHFDNQSAVRITYSPYAANSTTPFVQFDWDIPSLGSVGSIASSASVDPDLELAQTSSLEDPSSEEEAPDLELIADTRYEQTDLNPYIYRYTKSNDHERVGKDHPAAYGYLMWSVFNYIITNGAFSAHKLQLLRLFKNNRNCTPENVGDLFDAEGIIDQMKKEFAGSACWDNDGAQESVRGVLYFGLLNMLIQTIINEFIVSNIIVFSALNMQDVLDPQRPFRDLLVNYVVSSFKNTTTEGGPIVGRELQNYFMRVATRPATTTAGGFTHSYAPNEVVPGFESPGVPSSETEMIKFMVEERLGYTWDQNGTPRSTIKTIQNVIDPENTNKLFEDIFLEDVVGVYGTEMGADALQITHTVAAARINAQAPTANAFTDTIMITDFVSSDGERGIFNMWNVHWDPPMVGQPDRRKLAEFSYDPQNLVNRRQKLDFIKKQPEYKLMFSQPFDMGACLMTPILYNLFLTKKYFSDVGSSFGTTKRAIIEMFDMTDASSYPPRPRDRSEEFSETLANNGGQDLDSMARDIFLKFLAETPIQILKGLAELIDPHVSVSKIIRDVTGATFNGITGAIQKQINSAPVGSPLAMATKDKGITAHDIFSLIVCIYNTTTTVPNTLATLPGSDNLLFLPRVDPTKGVDFTGSVLGMLMMPPQPLGIAYILIELIRSLIEDAEEEAEEGPDAADQVDPVTGATIDCPEGTTDLSTIYTEPE